MRCSWSWIFIISSSIRLFSCSNFSLSSSSFFLSLSQRNLSSLASWRSCSTYSVSIYNVNISSLSPNEISPHWLADAPALPIVYTMLILALSLSPSETSPHWLADTLAPIYIYNIVCDNKVNATCCGGKGRIGMHTIAHLHQVFFISYQLKRWYTHTHTYIQMENCLPPPFKCGARSPPSPTLPNYCWVIMTHIEVTCLIPHAVYAQS